MTVCALTFGDLIRPFDAPFLDNGDPTFCDTIELGCDVVAVFGWTGSAGSGRASPMI